jgi:hypothetical protein
MSPSGDDAMKFWSGFALATLQQLAGEDRLVAGTLARALQRAVSDNIAPATVAMTTGIMGHAQQSGGLPEQARDTFERLRSDPVEYGHAIVHLGELALAAEGVTAGLEIWLTHPAGLLLSVTIIIDEADALWVLNPESSYRLAAAAVARLRAMTVDVPESAFETALARLAARTRENAMSPVPASLRWDPASAPRR